MYEILSKTEYDLVTTWVMSRDGGITRVVYQTPVGADRPDDLTLFRMEKIQNQTAPASVNTGQPKQTQPSTWDSIIKRNAVNRDRERKDRLKHNKSVTHNYGLKPPERR